MCRGSSFLMRVSPITLRQFNQGSVSDRQDEVDLRMILCQVRLGWLVKLGEIKLSWFWLMYVLSLC